jgi:DNA-binding NarL/FixJ family response regulator
MPNISGIEVTRRITTQAPKTAVVILSMHSSTELVREAVRAGARGYLLKESAGDDVVKAVRAVVAGKRFLGHGITDALIESCVLGRSGIVEHLTPREREVVRLVADGKSNAEAAATLGLSPPLRGDLPSETHAEAGPRWPSFAGEIRNSPRHHHARIAWRRCQRFGS